jgi:hypothetical protein
MIVEAIVQLYDSVFDSAERVSKPRKITIENSTGQTKETRQFLELVNNPTATKYMIVFVLFRFVEHMLIFSLAWVFWGHFISSWWFKFFGINFLALSMGNAVAVADLSLNTYMDIVLYLLSAVLIIRQQSFIYLFLVTLIAAFNRETAMLIPFLFLLFHISEKNKDWMPWVRIAFPSRVVLLKFLVLISSFVLVFLALRFYFGYRPQQVWKANAGIDMLMLNLFSGVAVKVYMELLGTFALIPILTLLGLRYAPGFLKLWFVFLVPSWFAVHFISVVAYQTRLFLVPMVLLILPIALLFMQKIGGLNHKSI